MTVNFMKDGEKLCSAEIVKCPEEGEGVTIFDEDYTVSYVEHYIKIGNTLCEEINIFLKEL